ncbi:hypothetical protein LTR78_001548 [Recurvomyces mirabilis]|uniref:Uncharacterized protein n=1 Tax=Recurvomyces mirabilis TaxID=574656 RepID=A0AAE0WUU6_9PEZI|nr:hypothetical protein LTR78_001548 [Recurvomyces mirabilis]KAK5151880.1 hypothetical protein LTS14_009014 [Recurvomyces mirabilis]
MQKVRKIWDGPHNTREAAVTTLPSERKDRAPIDNRQSTNGLQRTDPDLLETETIASLRQKIKEVDHETTLLKQRHSHEQAEQKNAFEAEIHKLQLQVFQDLRGDCFQPEDDTTITHGFMRIQNTILMFAKEYASDSLADLASQPEWVATELTHALNACEVASFSPTNSLSRLAQVRHMTRLCLTGLLSSAVHTMALDNPFFFMSDSLQASFDELPDQLQGLSNRIDPADAFHNTFHMISDGNNTALLHDCSRTDAQPVDPGKAHIWRSDTLRALTPDKQDTSIGACQLRDHVQSELVDKCAREADLFEHGPARLLMTQADDTLNDVRRQKLRKVFKDAGGFAMGLWTQRTGIEYRFRQEPADQNFLISSPFMQAHPLHKLDNPDDHSLDGAPVRLVLQPTVLRLGTHGAESYDQKSVWAKALVWIDTHG